MRWEPCVQHLDGDVRSFISGYFGNTQRRVLYIAAAGFHPLSTVFAPLLVGSCGDRMRAFLLREDRPGASDVLVRKGSATAERLRRLVVDTRVVHIDMFDVEDQAVTGGRTAVLRVSELDLSSTTDIVVDMSALTIGVSFPVLRWLIDYGDTHGVNVHGVVAHHGTTPSKDREFASAATHVHGFDGTLGLHSRRDNCAWLWVPQLALGKGAAFDGIHDFLRSRSEDALYEICPLLPFPSTEPRTADGLVSAYRNRLAGEWEVDARSILYAADDDPCDVYRMLLHLERKRAEVFAGVIGHSELLLSPLGGKAAGLGCLMAAIEADMAVVYQETLRYDQDESAPQCAEVRLAHVWLTGDAYR